MPKQNPKHRKKITQTANMGKASVTEQCYVVSCKETASHHISMQNLEGYLGKLNWKVDTGKKRSKKIALCKKHYKQYKKLKDKDEKFQKFRDFGPKKIPKKEKPHYFLE